MGIVKRYQKVVSLGGFRGDMSELGAGAESDAVKSITKTLSTTDIKALNSTPFTLIPAPGTGKYIHVLAIHTLMTFVTAAYTGSNNVEFRYTNGSGDKVTADYPYAALNIASSTALRCIAGVVTAQTPVANAAIVAYVPSANPAAGSGTLKIRVIYRVVKL